MSYAITAAAVVGAVGVGVSAQGASQARTEARRLQEQARFDTSTLRLLRDRAADTLDNLAQRLLNDEPVSDAERRVINQAQQVASQQIERQRQVVQKNVLEAQAATGFLKGGRTARQLRRLNIEAGESQQRIELAREQALVQATERRRALAVQALQSNLGLQPTTQQIPQGLPTASLIGTGITQIGGSLLQISAQQQAQQQQQEFLTRLSAQQQTPAAAPVTGVQPPPPGV